MPRRDAAVIGLAATGVVITMVLGAFYLNAQLSDNPVIDRSESYYSRPPLNDIPLFTNLSVLLMGSSSQTHDATRALGLCTANVTFMDDIGDPSSFRRLDIVMIDGEWLRDQCGEKVRREIAPLFLNGTAVIVLNGPSDVLSTILTENRIGGGFVQPADSFAMHYVPGASSAASLSLGRGDLDDGLFTMYNWCVGQRARMQLHD